MELSVFITANSWGCDDGGGCCVGCGNQEEFYACADITITPREGGGVTTTPPPTTTQTTASLAPGATTESPTTPRPGVPGGADPSKYVTVSACKITIHDLSVCINNA